MVRVRRFHHHDAAAKVNVTPLIDVVMCLIVFYLIVGRLASDRIAGIDLPTTRRGSEGPANAERRGVLTVNVVRGEGTTGTAVVNGRVVGADELRRLLEEHAGGLGSADPLAGVQVRADRSLAYAEVSWIVEACRDARITSVRLTTQRASGER